MSSKLREDGDRLVFGEAHLASPLVVQAARDLDAVFPVVGAGDGWRRLDHAVAPMMKDRLSLTLLRGTPSAGHSGACHVQRHTIPKPDDNYVMPAFRYVLSTLHDPPLTTGDGRQTATSPAGVGSLTLSYPRKRTVILGNSHEPG